MITFEEFLSFAGSYNVVPLVKTMLADLLTPVSTYLTLRQEGVRSFLFETVEHDEKIGRYSFVGVDPVLSLRERNGKVMRVEANTSTTVGGTIFTALAEASSRYRQAPLVENASPARRFNPVQTHPGFTGGFVGYIGYNAVRHLEHVAIPDGEPDNFDESCFDLFSSLVRFDHTQQSATIIHNVILTEGRSLREQYDAGRQLVETLELRLRRMPVSGHRIHCDIQEAQEFTDKEAFCRSVDRAKHYIHEGDIFQVVLSRRMRMKYSGDLFAIYRALRVINPSPYLFFLDHGHTKLVGSSPEVLVRVHEGVVDVLPIAGTRRRGASDDEDRSLERELLNDAKECAEHIMLVDLGRNDVGRIAEAGSVEVPVLKRVDRYSHVMHIVSHVRGRLRGDVRALDVLQACFPAGTVSGAPKVRAMEIISELEGRSRGLYAGAVGYLGFNGSLDTCIAIRTMFAHGDHLNLQAGAGIVADSVPELEFAETANKSRALIEAIHMAMNNLT
jgi:anthranilate synthase component I